MPKRLKALGKGFDSMGVLTIQVVILLCGDSMLILVWFTIVGSIPVASCMPLPTIMVVISDWYVLLLWSRRVTLLGTSVTL